MGTKVSKSNTEWKEQLSDLAYQVTQEQATERAFSHGGFPDSAGTFHCVCCGAPLFVSEAKFESGSGWPSFFKPVDQNAIDERPDASLRMQRVESVCANCDAHLGHVFPDGPQPTGQRYCINGVALKFREDDEDSSD